MSMILDVECIACNKTLQKINHDPYEVSRKMGKINIRRSRTPNWSVEEKQFLLELIRERKEVVVTKSNNGPNQSEEKDVAWNEILYQLAAKFGSKFTGLSIKKVKTQWQNMKRIAREEITFNGASLPKCSKQSQDVCTILESQSSCNDKTDIENFNDTTILTDVEIKTESVDEDMNQPSCSNSSDNQHDRSENPELKSSTSSVSIALSDVNVTEVIDEVMTIQDDKTMNNVSTETDYSLNDLLNLNSFHKRFSEFLRYSTTEKEIKMDSLKEERQVVRAMRETAELNKIIAEQKLKHVLWVKKQEMA